MLISLVDNVVMAIGFIAGLVYVRWLAARLPNDKIRQRARTLIVLISIFLGAGVLFGIAEYAGLLTSLRASQGVVMISSVVLLGLGIAGLVGIVMYYNLFSWLRADLTRVNQAQQIQPSPRAS